MEKLRPMSFFFQDLFVPYSKVINYLTKALGLKHI